MLLVQINKDLFTNT